MINLVTRNRPICNRPSEMGNLIAGSAIFMTPAWFSHFSVLFSLRFGFPPAREATEADFTHRLCRRRLRCLRRCNCNYWSLLQVFRPSIHNIYICVDTRIYLYIYKFGVVGIFSVVIVAVFDFFRSRPAWEMFATRLQSNGKSGFSFELKKKKQKQRCSKSENLPASDRLADHRFVCSFRWVCVFPAAWLSPPTSFYYSKVTEDVGINSPK